jgi:hypothetical protein
VNRHVRVGAENAAHAPGEGRDRVCLIAVATSARESRLLFGIQVKVSDLAGRVHAGVGAPGHDEPRITSQDAGEGLLQDALDRP